VRPWVTEIPSEVLSDHLHVRPYPRVMALERLLFNFVPFILVGRPTACEILVDNETL